MRVVDIPPGSLFPNGATVPYYGPEEFEAEHGVSFAERYYKESRVDRATEHDHRVVRRLKDPPPQDLPGTTIARILYGSWAHGTMTQDSDEDWRAVFQLPNEAFLGLEAPTTTRTQAPDMVAHELGHYMRLLLKGNPNIVGMLWAPGDCVLVRTPVWDALVASAEMWVTRPMASAYRGWIFREMANDDLPPKRMSHIPRLAYELESAVRDRIINVRLWGWRLDFVMAVKEGRAGIEEVRAEVGNLLEAIDPAIRRLPPPPTQKAQEMLLGFRGVR